jgi:small-conductance mechanosensitive channel
MFQQLPSEKKAIISLILGIASGGLLISIILMTQLVSPITTLGLLEMFGGLIAFLIYLFIPLIGIMGIIFGILGLKSTKKKFTIAGIVLCLIGLIVPLYYFLR